MNKLLLLAASISLCVTAAAQTNVYHPFPESDAEWRDVHALCDDPTNLPVWVWDYHYWLCGDTVINSLVYHKLCSEYSYNEEYFYGQQWLSGGYVGSFLNGAIREDSLRRIYYYDFAMQAETLMYDFSNLYVGAPLPVTCVNADSSAFISSIDSVLIGNSYRKSYRISTSLFYNFIPFPRLVEGVGFTSGLFHLEPGPSIYNVLLCYTRNQQIQFNQGFSIYHTCGTMVGLTENSNDEFVYVFPNPASGSFTIRLNNEIKNASVEIFNLQGQIIHSSLMSGDKPLIIEKFLSGLYFVKVTTDANQIIKKLVVE